MDRRLQELTDAFTSTGRTNKNWLELNIKKDKLYDNHKALQLQWTGKNWYIYFWNSETWHNCKKYSYVKPETEKRITSANKAHNALLVLNILSELRAKKKLAHTKALLTWWKFLKEKFYGCGELK